MRFLVIVLMILLAAFTAANGQQFYVIGWNPSLSQLNLGSGELGPQEFVNLFNAGSCGPSGGGSTPAALDSDGYPVRNFSGTIGCSFGSSSEFIETNGPFVFSWPAGRSSFRVIFLGQATGCVTSNATVSNCSGSGNFTITGDGVHAGSVTFSFTNAAGNQPPTQQFDGTYTSWGNNTANSGTMALYRQADAALFNAGQYWRTPFVNIIASAPTLSPRVIRPMAWNLPRNGSVQSNESLWAYRGKTSNLTFNQGGAWVPTAWSGGPGAAGTISVTNGALTAAAATDTTASGWADGEQIQGIIASTQTPLTVTGAVSNGGNVQLTVASTTGLVMGNPVHIDGIAGTTEANGYTTVLSVDSMTQFTINVVFVHTYTSGGTVDYFTLAVTGKTGGPWLIVNNLGVGIGAGFSSDQTQILSGNATFTWDKVLGAVLYTSGGLSTSVPIEAQVQLANLTGSALWYNLPTWSVDNYVTSALNLIYPLLNRNLTLEYSNEVWNFAWVQAQWSAQRAAALGIGGDNDYYGLRLRQIFGNLVPSTGSPNRVDRIYSFQGGTGTGDISVTNQMKGNSLVSPGSAAYQTFVGGASVNYNTAPNRPIDVTDSLGYAPYVSASALAGQSSDAFTAPSACDATLLQSIIDNTNGGNTSVASALIDANIRTGLECPQTVTASGTTFTTPLAHGWSVGNIVQFTVSGGTTYSGLSLTASYIIKSTPLSNTFTADLLVNNIDQGTLVNAGTAGSGTTSVGQVTQGFPRNSAAWYTKWEAVAASFDSGRPSGMGPLNVKWYEGALEPTAPTTAQCTTLGLVSPNPGGTAAAASTVIATAIVNWKNSALSFNTINAYYNLFLGLSPNSITTGAMPHSKGVSQLVLLGGGEYGLVANFDLSNPSLYQTYNGFAAFGKSPGVFN